MRVLIIGTGASGTLVGAALEEAGVETTYMVRPERQRQLITTGLQISSPLGRFRKPVQAVLHRQAKGTFDVVIIATRANFYQMGLFLLGEAISNKTIVVPIFDGAHHLGYWRERFPQNPIVIARFDIRATLDADGIVRQNHPGGELAIGQHSGPETELLEQLVAKLRGRRFGVQPCGKDVVTQVWARHIFRAAAAATSRMAGMPLRDAIRFHNSKMFEKLLMEGHQIAMAHRVPDTFKAVHRYRTGVFREGMPIQAPPHAKSGSRESSEGLFLMANMLRQAQDKKVEALLLLKAWKQTEAAAPANPDQDAI